MLKHNFDKIDHYLTATKQYWHYNAFILNDYPSFSGNNALINFLHSIDDNKLLSYQQNPASLYPLLKQFIPELLNISDSLFDIKSNLLNNHIDAPFWLKKGIKGRKWVQVDQFSNYIEGTLPILEWCAGKGHLGRLIHYKTKNEISAVEWNDELCNQGLQLAQQQSISQPFFVSNVLLGEASQLLSKKQHVVALHACGDLHVHLINGVKKALTEKVTISPCCYHLTEHDNYQAVSSYALQQSQLLSSITLSKQDLKLAVAQQSTSGERQTQLNDQEVWWRLSFDCLQKELLQTEAYLTVPSFPKTLLSNNFRDFAEWVTAYKQLDIELPTDLSVYLAQGQVRFNRLRRSELVSQFFRRPLELWLIYDRALSLQEAGYQVKISRFCDANITPRNLLIQASR
ncbi:methyltransferase [uncultured Psychromonas sp.]|uniref:methyltransferase n=1 Tax=uncultured Psychromonas sp. TaxID=173974 RepID=UPI002634BF60|nr:methyltransferase [uncultured Psychromonas sp.]